MYKYLFISTLLFFTFFNQVNAATETVRIYSHESDWGIQTSPYPGSWVTQYYSTYGIDTTNASDRSTAFVGIYNSDQGYLGIHRSFLSFDTSIIPNDAIISTAYLKVSPEWVRDEVSDSYSYMSVLLGRQDSATAHSYDDIEMCGDTLENPIKGSENIDLSNIFESEPLVFTLNHTGISWIEKGGYTKLCIREGHDIENIELINNQNYWLETGISYYTSEKEGTEFDPYLEITYTVEDEPEDDVYELLGELIEAVEGYDFKYAIEKSYMANLKKIEKFLKKGKYTSAKKQLHVFMQKLKQDEKHGKITSEQYDDLVSRSNEVMVAIQGL